MKYFFFARKSEAGKFENSSGTRFDIEKYPEGDVNFKKSLFKEKRPFKTLEEYLKAFDLKHI
jgi:hypothetical protein